MLVINRRALVTIVSCYTIAASSVFLNATGLFTLFSGHAYLTSLACISTLLLMGTCTGGVLVFEGSI